MKLKSKLVILVIIGLTSCSVSIPLSDKKLPDDVKITKLTQSTSKDQYIDIGNGKTGASISLNISSPSIPKKGVGGDFLTKANTNGSSAKTFSDVKSYEFYLIKNKNSPYPSNGDPIGDKVAGPFVKNISGASTTITFNNVGDSGGQYYYVAVRVFDKTGATGNSIAKVNPSLIGTTANSTYNGQVAVSSSGSTVDSSFVVTPSTAQSINVILLDIVGAKIDTSITVNNGSNSGSLLFNSINATGKFKVSDNGLVSPQNIADMSHGISTASDSAGDFVVTWTSSYSQNISAYGGISAQRYKSDGSKQGSEFKVNTYTKCDKHNQSVAMDSAGDFVVAWESNGQDGDQFGIYAQRYTSAATLTPQGSEFKVNTYTTGNQRNPSVAMDSAGDFVVAWQSYDQDGSRSGVYAQRYASAATLTPQGSEFQVNTYTTNNQGNPIVAMDSIGDFVVSWESIGQDGRYGGYGVYAQRYKSDGSKQGSEFKVNTYTTGDHTNPSVSMDSAGDFVVAWSYTDLFSSQIRAQKYNNHGIAQVPGGCSLPLCNPATGEFQVKYGSPYPYISNVAMDSSGDFVIISQNFGVFGYGITIRYGIYANRYNSAGAIQIPAICNMPSCNSSTGEFQVEDNHTVLAVNSSVAIDSTGDFIVSWADGLGAFQKIYAKRYYSNGIVK